MRRTAVRRILLIVSAVLVAGVGWLWRRSHRWSDVVRWPGRGRVVEVASLAGGVQVRDVRAHDLPPSRWRRVGREVTPGADWRAHLPEAWARIEWERAGFALAAGSAIESTAFVIDAGPIDLSALPPGVTAAPSGGEWSSRRSPTGRGGGGGSPPRVPLMLMRSHQVVVVPYWFVALVMGVPLWLAVLRLPWRLRTWRRRRRGLCLSCGYDRRHSPERCPECGAG